MLDQQNAKHNFSCSIFYEWPHTRSGQNTNKKKIHYRGDYYFIYLVDSVCVPSTCSFLRCFATCSAVGKEQLHFGHVKPVSDIMSDWTILNKKHTSVCYSLIQIAQLDMLIFFSLFTQQTQHCRQQQASNHDKWY